MNKKLCNNCSDGDHAKCVCPDCDCTVCYIKYGVPDTYDDRIIKIRKQICIRLDNAIKYNWEGGFEKEFFINYIIDLLNKQRDTRDTDN